MPFSLAPEIRRVVAIANVCSAALLVGTPAMANPGTDLEVSPRIGRSGTDFALASNQELHPRSDAILAPPRSTSSIVESTSGVPIRLCLDALGTPDFGALFLSRNLSATITADMRHVIVGVRRTW